MAPKDTGIGVVDTEIDWSNFLRNKVNSFIKWDLVRFFHDNPHAADTAENIARYIGRDPRGIMRELTGLVTSGVLQKDEVAGVTIYRLTDEQSVRDTITKFVEACHDREFRVKAIYNVIHGMEFSSRHDF